MELALAENSMENESGMSQNVLDVGEAAYENLRGFEEELMVFLDMFNTSDQEASCNSSTDAEQHLCSPRDDVDAVPDLMTEGLTCWTDLLMDDFPDDKLLAIPDCDALNASGFLSIGLEPNEPAAIRPSLPHSLFHTLSADSSTAEALTQEARLYEHYETPAAPDSLGRFKAAPSVPQDSFVSSLDPMVRAENMIIDGTAEQNCANSAMSSHTQASMEEQSCSTIQQTSIKRKRASKRTSKPKQRDPAIPKRRPGRPRVTPGLNCLKHIKAFEEEGGFTSQPGAFIHSLPAEATAQQNINHDVQG